MVGVLLLAHFSHEIAARLKCCWGLCSSSVVLLLLCVPAASYNALLEICYKSNDSDRALDVIDRMADDEVEPDDLTWELAARKRTWRSYMRKVMG